MGQFRNACFDHQAPSHARFTVRALIVHAIAREARGDMPGADQSLERALSLSEGDGALLPFLMQSVPSLLEGHSKPVLTDLRLP